MSNDKNKYYALGSIVDDFIDDNDLHQSFWHKALKWGIRAVREIRLDIFQHPKTEILTVTERKTVVLPAGFVDWTKVAVKRGQYVITLAVNDELASQERSAHEDTVRGLLSQHLPNGTDFGQYGGYYFYNFNGNTLASIGGGLPSKGHFKVFDHGDCKELLLDYDYSYSTVYLEYITDGIDPCKETIIHPYEYEYVMAFMDMMYEKKNNPKATNYSKEDAARDVHFAGKKLRGRFNDLSPRDILTMSRAEARMTTKL
jgi:hypothetical protein